MEPHLVYPPGYNPPQQVVHSKYTGPPLYQAGMQPRPYIPTPYPGPMTPMAPRYIPAMSPYMPSPHQYQTVPSPQPIYHVPSPHQYHAVPNPHQYHAVPNPHQYHAVPSPHQYHPVHSVVPQPYPHVQAFRAPQPMVPIPNMVRAPSIPYGQLSPVVNPIPVNSPLPPTVTGTYDYPYMTPPDDPSLDKPCITYDHKINGYTYGDMLIRGYVGSFDASGTEGILAKTGSGVEARFGKENIYIGGKKVSMNQQLWEIISKETNLRAIIKTIANPNAVGPFHSLNQATIVWFGEIPIFEHVMSDLVVEMIENTVSPEKQRDSPSLESEDSTLITAYIWWADSLQGVLRIYEEQGWGTDFSGIYFKSCALSINGKKVKTCNALHLLVANFNKCKVTAHKVSPRTICGITVCWEATVVECGPAPESLKNFIKETSKIVEETLNNNVDEVFEENLSDNSINSDCNTSETDEECSNNKDDCDSHKDLNESDDNDTNLNEDFNKKLSLSDCILIRGCIEGFNKSGDAGYINCNTKSESMLVWFSKENFYTGGRKVDTKTSLRKILSVGRNVRAIISESGSPDDVKFECSKSNNAQAKYLNAARIVWLGEVPMDNILIPRTLKLKEKDASVQENKALSSSANFMDIVAYVWWANSDQGILRLYEQQGWGNKFTGILFSIDAVHINGFQVSSCQDLFKLVAHFNKCKVKAAKIIPMTMHGMTVTWEAVLVECDNPPDTIKPLVTKAIKHHKKQLKKAKRKNSIKSNKASISSESNSTAAPIAEKTVENSTFEINLVEKVVNEPIQEKQTHHQSKQLLENINSGWENPRPPSQESASSHESWIDDEDVLIKGKYITGLIIKHLKDVGVAQWKSMDYGEVYISFSPENIYIDNTPLLYKINNQADVYSRRCNFYVVPCEPQYLEGVTINLQATCGWMGSKPSYIPAPGEQPLSKISLANLKICKISQTKWKEVGPGPKVEKEKENNNDMCNSIKSEKQNAEASGYQHTSALDNTPHNTRKSSKEQITSIGTVEEVHSHVGRLKATNGEIHYFSSNICFLYGICLEKVELWHVLVHGQNVNYCMGNGIVDRVWIGSKTINEGRKSAQMISEWCKENSVPNAAKELLMSAIQQI